MKQGIGTYTFMWSIGFPGAVPDRAMDAFELLEFAHRNGVSVVQYGPNLPLQELAEDVLDRLFHQSAEYRIEIEIGIRGIEAGCVQRAISLARKLQARMIRCTVERAPGIALTPNELESALREVQHAVQDHGLLLAVENSLLPARSMASVLESFACPALGVTLDTVNSLAIPEGTHEVIRHLARHVHCLHIKDFFVRRLWHSMGFSVEGRPAGQGQLDVPALLRSIHAAGAAPRSAILELWPPEQTTLAGTIALEHLWAEESLRFLGPLLSSSALSGAIAETPECGHDPSSLRPSSEPILLHEKGHA